MVEFSSLVLQYSLSALELMQGCEEHDGRENCDLSLGELSPDYNKLFAV